MTTKRYPIEPLLAMLRVSANRATQELRMGGGAYLRYRRDGMTREAAERLADRAGFHVYEVWPDMAIDDAGPLEQKCAAPDCPVMFVAPTLRLGQKRRHYCSRTCQQRTNARVRYQSDEATRQRRCADSRRYKQEIKELVARRSVV